MLFTNLPLLFSCSFGHAHQDTIPAFADQDKIKGGFLLGRRQYILFKADTVLSFSEGVFTGAIPFKTFFYCGQESVGILSNAMTIIYVLAVAVLALALVGFICRYVNSSSNLASGKSGRKGGKMKGRGSTTSGFSSTSNTKGANLSSMVTDKSSKASTASNALSGGGKKSALKK